MSFRFLLSNNFFYYKRSYNYLNFNWNKFFVMHQTCARWFVGVYTYLVNGIISVRSDLMASCVLQIQEKDFAVKQVLSLIMLSLQFIKLLFGVSAGSVCFILSWMTFLSMRHCGWVISVCVCMYRSVIKSNTLSCLQDHASLDFCWKFSGYNWVQIGVCILI